MRAILTALVVAGAAVPAAAAQVAVRANSLYSPSLGRSARFQVVLPDGYDSTRTYPLLWLLHGFWRR